MKTKVASLCVPAFLVVFLASSGCGGDNDKKESPTPTPTPMPADPLFGSWERTSGELFAYSYYGNFSYLSFGSGGAGVVSRESETNHVAVCAPFLYAAVDENILSIDVPSIASPSTEFVSFNNFVYSSPDADTLVLTNAAGVSATFSRISAVPASATCGLAALGTPIPIPASREPEDSRRGLTSDGMLLYYSVEGGAGVTSFSPATGSTGALVTFPSSGQFKLLLAIEGNDFWLHCGCGSGSYLQKWTSGNVMVEQVLTASPEINRETNIAAGFWDGASLRITGYDFTTARPVILTLDTTAEPDELESALALDMHLESLVLHDGELWGLTSYPTPILVSLDPVSGLATSTRRMPPGRYSGLASLGGTMYTIRSNAEDDEHEIVPILQL
jgi:hypothetical protein